MGRHAGRRSASGRLLVGDKDAAGVAVEVFVHAQGFIRIVRAIEPQAPSEGKHALVHGPQFIRVADSQIEMELLRNLRLRPRRPPDHVDLLKGEDGDAVLRPEVEPVATPGIVVTRTGLLMTGPVLEPEQLSPELGTPPRVRRVNHHLTQARPEFLHGSGR